MLGLMKSEVKVIGRTKVVSLGWEQELGNSKAGLLGLLSVLVPLKTRMPLSWVS